MFLYDKGVGFKVKCGNGANVVCGVERVIGG